MVMTTPLLVDISDSVAGIFGGGTTYQTCCQDFDCFIAKI